jgi:hypothetical protein
MPFATDHLTPSAAMLSILRTDSLLMVSPAVTSAWVGDGATAKTRMKSAMSYC